MIRRLRLVDKRNYLSREAICRAMPLERSGPTCFHLKIVSCPENWRSKKERAEKHAIVNL
jgi:hypothetical protein